MATSRSNLTHSLPVAYLRTQFYQNLKQDSKISNLKQLEGGVSSWDVGVTSW